MVDSQTALVQNKVPTMFETRQTQSYSFSFTLTHLKPDNFLSKSKSSGITIEIVHDFNLMSQPIKNDDCQYIVRHCKLINTFEVAALERERI